MKTIKDLESLELQFQKEGQIMLAHKVRLLIEAIEEEYSKLYRLHKKRKNRKNDEGI